ncbi:MAG: hypothetical protein LAO51_08960 [Acidobacteriia bacterium]|nr:hypothetical protein [Terriglobia bacterium]
MLLILVVGALYMATWLVASRTLAPQLKSDVLDQIAALTVDRDSTIAYATARLQSEREDLALKSEVHITRIVPVLPGVVLAWHDFSMLFRAGGQGVGGFGNVSLVVVYGFGERRLYSRKLWTVP